MARSTKAARRITVDSVEYRWRATGNDGYITITVWPSTAIGPAILGNFGYHETYVSSGEANGYPCWKSLHDQVVITNRIVRRVIDYARTNRGYDPHVCGKVLKLGGMDKEVDLADAIRANE